MTRTRTITASLILALSSGLTERASAQAPVLLTQHGTITQGVNPVSGATQLTFRLYAQVGDSTAIWEETQSVTCEAGYFSVVLGRSNPLDAADLAAAPDLHLGIAVAAGSELSPRLPVTSVPYALSAELAALASDVSCTACVSATEVAFSYAGSASAGGPATALECTEACVQAGELDNGAVTSSKIAAGAVDTLQLATAAVTLPKLAVCPATQTLRVTAAGAWECTGTLTISDAGAVSVTGTLAVSSSLTANTISATGSILGGAGRNALYTVNTHCASPGLTSTASTCSSRQCCYSTDWYGNCTAYRYLNCSGTCSPTSAQSCANNFLGYLH